MEVDSRGANGVWSGMRLRIFKVEGDVEYRCAHMTPVKASLGKLKAIVDLNIFKEDRKNYVDIVLRGFLRVLRK